MKYVLLYASAIHITYIIPCFEYEYVFFCFSCKNNVSFKIKMLCKMLSVHPICLLPNSSNPRNCIVPIISGSGQLYKQDDLEQILSESEVGQTLLNYKLSNDKNIYKTKARYRTSGPWK